MKVLYIHQYYRKPENGGGIRSYYLTKELVKKGFQVKVITTHNQSEYLYENVNGVGVHYLPIYYDNSLSFKSRIRSFLKFVLLAIKKSYSIKGIEICYVMTTPLTTGIIALWLKFIRGLPYVFEVGDLWPLVPIEMGVIKNRVAKKILTWFEKLCYKNAKGIVTLSPGISDHIKTLTPDKPVQIIPNIADTDFFAMEEKRVELKEKYGIENEFVISYTGTLGQANHLEYLMEAAQITRGLQIKFLIVGDGSEKDRLLEIKEKNLLTNIIFLPNTDKSGVKEILNISDAVYISFANFDSLHTGSPNKLFDGLAAGKLIVANFGGWVKKLVESNDAGFSYDPEKPVDFLEKILLFNENKQILKSFQKNSRQLAENSYSLEKLSEKQLEFIGMLDR